MFNKIKLFFKRNDNDGKQLKELTTLFINSPEEGISQAKIYLMSPNFTNYDEFINDVKKTQKSNCCIVSWTKSMLSARCLDCQKHDNSCICIPCYLAGKHDQHHSYLLGGSGSGNCDCGDPNFWKPEGNCPHHPGPDPNPEVTQMTPENQTKFINVFKIAYNAALTTNNDAYLIQIFNWISDFISFGDGLRRCVAIAVASAPEKLFLSKLSKLEKEPFNNLLNLFGKLISDHYFGQKIGQLTIKNYLSLRNLIRTELLKSGYNKKSIPFRPTKKYLNFAFHFFNENTLIHMTNEYKFDWVSFIINNIKYIFDTIKQTNMDYQKNQDGQIISQIWYLNNLLEILVKKDDQHENIQKFINKYSSLVVNYEGSFHFTFPREEQDDSDSPFLILFLYIYMYQMNIIFSPKNDDVSQKNRTFSIDTTFSTLLNFLNAQKKLKPESITSGTEVPISAFLPLHHLFYCLLSSYKNPHEVLSELCQKKKISIQDFCCLSSIYPLRFLTAVAIPERFRMLNSSTFRQISYFLDKPEETFNFFFGLVQTMYKISPDKEQFLSMVAETFGVFDSFHFFSNLDTNFEELLMNLTNQMEVFKTNIFDASVFIISLITDNSISTFNSVLFKRLRAIEIMTIFKPTARDIENWVSDKLNNPIFGDDLQSFAERVSSSNGYFFRLKDDQHEFTPFFPVISRNNKIKILMKYNDKLVPIPDYKVDVDKFASMISCFNSPTFISLMYSCLVNNKTMFNQIGLAMFVLAARNGPKYDFQNANENRDAILVNSFSELVDLFKNNKENPFLLRIKLNKDGNDLSIIEAVQSLKRIGYEAFEKTDLPDFLRPKMDEDEDEIQREKKARAANLKQSLLKEFQNKRSQFTMGGPSSSKKGKTGAGMNNGDEEDYDDQGGEEEEKMFSKEDDLSHANDASEILCNVCQTEVTDDILGFPCLSLPCVFPSLINRKLHHLEIDVDNLEKVYSMSICLHHVHHKCCASLLKKYKDDYGTLNENHAFNCMIDRGTRNCFLPLFPDSADFTTEASEVMTEAVQSFMKEAFFDLVNENDPTIPVKSYAGTVLTIEVRHRSRPECLDNPTVPSLLRNMLHTFYSALHGKVSLDKAPSDPLERLVFMLISSESPRDEHRKFVKQIAVSLEDDDYLYEFLRRAAIIEDFALKGESEKGEEKEKKFIDWDEILSFENLIERYEIEKEDFENTLELPLFETIPLADRFVGLYQPPYNMDIFDISIPKFIDLLTGKVVFFSKNELEIPERPEIPHVTEYVREKYHGGLAMFLGLTGPNASDIIISCPSINRLFNLDGFYVDQFGDIDRGFKIGAILSLSKDRLENALDKLLSGDVILY